MKRILCILLALLCLVSLIGCSAVDLMDNLEDVDDQLADLLLHDDETEKAAPAETEAPAEDAATLDENGSYDSKEDVALYIHLYNHLPPNYITKKEAEALGWTGGSLEPYAPGCCIGGGYFGNYEGLLPEAKGRSYTECDIGTIGKSSRGAKRIVFSNDGLIFYTGDHYESFELLYGEAEGW